MPHLSHLQVRNPKDDETPIESASQIFASALSYGYIPWWKRLYLHPKTYAFELFLLNQTIFYYVTTPQENEVFIQSLISAAFPTTAIKKTTDPMDIILKSKYI